MARERRTFGRLRKLRSGRYQAAYVGPDDQLHTAESTFAAKLDAEAWLTDRRREIDRELWSPPATGEQKRAKRKAELRFSNYADKWLQTRTVKGRPLRPRTHAHYRFLLDEHILPTFRTKPVRSITASLSTAGTPRRPPAGRRCERTRTAAADDPGVGAR